ncbi:hypothetical protein ES703_44369 [subsurface metagenome]
MRRLAAYITVLLVVLAVALAGCNNGETPSPQPPELDGSQWALRSLDGEELVAGSHISIYFRDGSFWGNGGCNIYGGDYATEDPDSLTISGVGYTDVGCLSPPGVMEQEAAYFDALGEVAFCSVADGRLEISDSDHQKRLVFDRKPEYAMEPADLVGTSWLLVSTDGEEVTEGLSITLSFDSDTIASGRAGCFDYTLPYEASGDDIRCGMDNTRDGELAFELEREALDYIESLAWGANYRLAEGRLEIFTARGETLVYEPSYDHD